MPFCQTFGVQNFMTFTLAQDEEFFFFFQQKVLIFFLLLYENMLWVPVRSALSHNMCFHEEIKKICEYPLLPGGGGWVVRRCCVSYITGASN